MEGKIAWAHKTSKEKAQKFTGDVCYEHEVCDQDRKENKHNSGSGSEQELPCMVNPTGSLVCVAEKH